jgi:hypothetical protein
VKASISGRIACERLIKQEKINKKLIEDSQKLSHDFKLSQATNLDLEKKVAELAVALKSCQDEKKLLKRPLIGPKKILRNYRRHMMMICG